MFGTNQIRSNPLCRRLALASVLALACGATPAMAEVGSAGAYDVSVTLTLLGSTVNVNAQTDVNIDLSVDPLSDLQVVPGFEFGSAALVHLTTDALSSEAEYRPGVSFSASAGQSQVAGLNLSAVGLLGVNLLQLSADVIRSKSLVAGYCLPTANKGAQTDGLLDDVLYGNGFDAGNLGAGGNGAPGTGPDDSVGLANVHLSILGIDVPLPLNPPPNTGVDIPAGIVGATLILNEQRVEGDGINQLTKTSNGLRLTLNILNLISGEVIVAHSSAGIDCTH